MKKIIIISVIFIVSILLLMGCVPGDGTYTDTKPAGFFWGIWHGWIAPVSLIISIFNKNIGIYEVSNTGFGYNFGFYIAVISGFGGLSVFRKKRSKK
ncbi:UNVERIFIED_CONTAM: hypothetical protein Cloal_3729 [Acetivibrio alkalicellulosi]